MNKKNDAIRRELERIAKANRGVLWPRKVVEAARAASSPLHSRFEWDNTAAAQKYRIWQARMLIAVTVNVISEVGKEEQVWVSLKSDRGEAGGYRSLVTVLTDRDLRKQLLEDALQDMEIFEQKYRHLKELAEVFASMQKIRKR